MTMNIMTMNMMMAMIAVITASSMFFENGLRK